jgi:hypothetical protein
MSSHEAENNFDRLGSARSQRPLKKGGICDNFHLNRDKIKPHAISQEKEQPIFILCSLIGRTASTGMQNFL